MNHEKTDVAILGGGLAGLTLAMQLRSKLPDASITVLEKRKHPVPEAAFKVGESTVEVGAHYFGQILGQREHILQQQLPKLGLRFFFPNGDNSRIEDRLELGGKRFAPCPSYQIDRGRFENHLADECLDRGIQFRQEAAVDDFDIGGRRGGHTVRYTTEGTQRELSARWLVDASGRRAFIKRKLDLAKPSPHVGNAAWFRFKKHIKVDDWCDDANWQAGHEGKTGRWYSTNHLMGDGYWVWLIPLASGSTSMGIVASEKHHPLSMINSLDKAVTWLEKHEPQCAAAVRDRLDDIQDFRAIKHYAVECKQVFSGQRWGITGEAGFFHDPFYSPGSDFIAFANTFLTDLIRRDLTGREYRIRAYSYDKVFKKFYYGTASAYCDQYGIFGNPTVMPVKILWDYMVYWSITGFIFMHDRMCEQSMYVRNMRKLNRLSRLNHFMQMFLRDWSEQTKHDATAGSINVSEIPLIRQSNSRLLEPLEGRRFYEQFASNVEQLETLCCEIVESSGLGVEHPYRKSTRRTVMADGFQQVFSPIPRAAPAEPVSALA